MDNRIYKTIRNKYEHFFRVSPKVNSAKGKHSRIIKSDMYDSYVKTVLNDEEICLQTRALVALLCSTGCRITEVLNLRVDQLNFEAKRVERILILKKRIREIRLQRPIHPYALEFLQKYVEGKKGDDYILNFENRHQAFRRLERYFDCGCHDYRHSFIAYFLASKNGQSLEKVTNIMGWSSVSMAYVYSNVDTTQEVDTFFQMVA